jgi:hypothetical protein
MHIGFGWKARSIETTGKFLRRLENDIKIGLREIVWGVIE